MAVAILGWRFYNHRSIFTHDSLCLQYEDDSARPTLDLWLLASSFSDARLSLSLRLFLSFLPPFSFSGRDVSAIASSGVSELKVSMSRLTCNRITYIAIYRWEAPMVWRSYSSPCGYDINTPKWLVCNDTYKLEILHSMQWNWCGKSEENRWTDVRKLLPFLTRVIVDIRCQYVTSYDKFVLSSSCYLCLYPHNVSKIFSRTVVVGMVIGWLLYRVVGWAGFSMSWAKDFVI